MENEKNKKILAMMNDSSLCPELEESKIGISNYTKLPMNRLAAMGIGLESIASAVQKVTTESGRSGLYYVNTSGKTMFRMKKTNNFIGSLKTSKGAVGGGQAQMTQIALDPTALFMAITLASIDGFSYSKREIGIEGKSYFFI